MNWFKKMWANPNVHIAFGTLSGVAATAFPQYAMPLAAVAAVLGVNGIVQPELPAQPAAAVRSLHADDYLAIAQAVVAAVKSEKSK